MTAAPSEGAPAAIDDDGSLALARRYAEALVNAAQKEGPVEPALDDLEAIVADVLDPNPRFVDLLGSSRVPRHEKDRILRELFEGRAADVVVRFLRTLNRHDRLDLVRASARAARAVWDERNRRVPVHVRSAVPLDEERLRALSERLAKLVDGAPILTASTDPELIGGLVVEIGDLRYDASVRNRLAQLRHRLIEEIRSPSRFLAAVAPEAGPPDGIDKNID